MKIKKIEGNFLKINFKVMLMTIFLSASMCVEAMHPFQVVVTCVVPLASGLTIYNDCNTSKDKDGWQESFAQRKELLKAARFNGIHVYAPLALAAQSFLYLGASCIAPLESQQTLLLEAALGASLGAVAWQQYNRRQLDHAKKWASVDFQGPQDKVGSVENV